MQHPQPSLISYHQRGKVTKNLRRFGSHGPMSTRVSCQEQYWGSSPPQVQFHHLCQLGRRTEESRTHPSDTSLLSSQSHLPTVLYLE